MMPVEIEGHLTVSKDDDGLISETSLTWGPRTLPLAEESTASFKIGPRLFIDEEEQDRYFAEQQAALGSLRDEHVPGLNPLHVTIESIYPVLELRGPATKLALEWLKRELRALEWL